MRLYPDVYGRRFAWMFADLIMVAWIYLCVRAGLWVNNLVLQLDALAQGVINAGKTFDSWILSFEQGIPNSVPYLSDFLHRTAEALKIHSGDSLISAGQAGPRGIHPLALLLAIIVTAGPLPLPPAGFPPPPGGGVVLPPGGAGPPAGPRPAAQPDTPK